MELKDKIFIAGIVDYLVCVLCVIIIILHGRRIALRRYDKFKKSIKILATLIFVLLLVAFVLGWFRGNWSITMMREKFADPVEPIAKIGKWRRIFLWGRVNFLILYLILFIGLIIPDTKYDRAIKRRYHWAEDGASICFYLTIIGIELAHEWFWHRQLFNMVG